jgi:elongation factor G
VADQPAGIRNVVLVGHTGSGKTTLVEARLVATGALNRAGRVEDGTTVSDFEDAEVRQQRSVSLALAPIEYDGVKINLLDAPGYADFVGDLRAGLRAADAALFVMSAADGIDGSTRMLWEECAHVGMPRAVVVSKVDSPRADFDAVVAQCQANFGQGVLPLYLPMRANPDAAPHGLLGLITHQVGEYAEGGRTSRDATSSEIDDASEARNALLEGIIAESEDETLMDRYLAGEEIDPKAVIDVLEKAVARGWFYPVLAASAPSMLGTAVLLDLLARAFP